MHPIWRRTDACRAELEKLPKVEGGSGQVYLAPETARLFEQAEKIAEKAGDQFVTAERLLLALALAANTVPARILKDAGVTAQGLNHAIEEVRKGLLSTWWLTTRRWGKA